MTNDILTPGRQYCFCIYHHSSELQKVKENFNCKTSSVSILNNKNDCKSTITRQQLYRIDFLPQVIAKTLLNNVSVTK